MEMTNLQAEYILTTYENFSTGMVDENQIQQALEYLPEENSGIDQDTHVSRFSCARTKMKAITNFVIFNNEKLENMRTTLINEQTGPSEVVPDYALESSATVKKPIKKRKYTPRKKR